MGSTILNSKSLAGKIVALVLFLVLPISVSAGLINAISNIFSRGVSAENLPPVKNIQNMALLVAINNPLNDNNSQINLEGDALVSQGGPSGRAVESMSKPTSDQISVYVVRSGDTISEIAKMFNVTVNTIKWGNDLKSNTLRVGETLVILPISGVRHIVSEKDSIDSIAKKYKGDKDEIIAYNNIDESGTLEVGSTIIIPDGEVVPVITSLRATSLRNTPVSPKLRELVGYFLRPIVGGVRTQGLHGYNGIDIGVPVGTPILAAADGEVIISRMGGWNGGYGNYIVIRHPNGTQTLYAHNNANFVSVGDIVKQGDVIGTVGVTGRTTGPHLHFEVRGARNPF